MRPFRLLYICIWLQGMLAVGAKAQGQASSNVVALNWNSYETVLPSQNFPSGKIPSFSGASIDATSQLPYYKLQLPGISINDFQITAPIYEPLSADDQKLYADAAISSEPAVTINNSRQNKVPVSLISVIPLRRNPQSGQVEKLVSFSYTYITPSQTVQSLRRDNTSNIKNTSALSSGEWYKIGVTASGIHKIDKTTLQALGLNTQSLDPRTIQLYGNGGGMLPQKNSDTRIDDLAENAIFVNGESDGRFDDSDYILFYAQGPHTWSYDASQSTFSHQYNVYSDTSFYFIRVGGATAGMRISTRGQSAGSNQTITSYDERFFHERDINKGLIPSGREWYGEEFNFFTASREVTFPVTDVVPGSTIRYKAAMMANAPTATSYTHTLNTHTLGTQSIGGRGTYDYHPEGIENIRSFTVAQQALGNFSELKANISLNSSGSSSALGYINYLELHVQRLLKLYGNQTAFRSIASLAAANTTFQIDAPASAVVWDVTNHLQPVVQATQSVNGLSFSTSTTTLREFVVFQNGTGIRPIALGKLQNQNLHALNLNGDLDFVIVTHPLFLQEATRLARHREQHSNLKTVVVTTREIYNEFSSGAQDVTAIRDFMRMIHRRSRKSRDEILYLLLFGDTSYDFKNRIPNNTNFIPAYQSRQSLHPITSYSSEDYYGFLDDDEGEWAEDNSGDHLLDIGVGRLPVKSSAEAATIVDKIIAYESPSHFGKWRNQITFIADDGDGNEHQDDAEFLANYIEQEHPAYNNNKVYLDLFRQVVVSNGQRSPEASAAVDKAAEQGSLIMNYTGHGNETWLASEQLLTLPQITSWRNKDKLTFMLTATCEFGRYDNPARVSGAEIALLHKQGGAVGLIATTRPVYSNGNRVLNRNFFQSAFTPINGRMPRLGDLVQQTKNKSITDNVSGSRGVNNRNFTLLADPSMQLAYPTYQAQVTRITNAADVATDTLSALGKITIEGQIVSASGVKADNFDGNIHLTVYEKQTTLNTLGDEDSKIVPVKLRENIIYDGQASVKNGIYNISFVVPKDIAYNYGAGKISLYANSQTQDALGATTSITIGGTAKNVPADNTPPTIELFMNDESFVFGGHTGRNPVLLAKFYDENGINTAGLGIGHEITGTLNDNRDNPLILNDYYTADVDSYQSGKLNYNFKDLEDGLHTIKVKAWDTHNNSTEEYIEFFVSNDAKIALEHLLNYPNPFSNKTTFHFDHNRAGEDLDIQIQIYTISGKLIKTLETTSFSSKSHVADLTWDGRDEYNDVIARGVYIYKVNVRSHQDGSKISKFEKLVILN
ncbi:type IX secretion system sortase PorU [Pontibacter sp. SGAir0037]|uniref:type IX secretion system sortase PorU n=1 Tax=Pontibacter sp. SGAir0037 TaxID=2571030 RepID=UPI0010CD3B6D|nr:type IX secretion system sortase PorU [Pontibacter sp. SGAir0037]QCR24397.1 hypothetical protein C1N53_19910 [Pontibacter sp. SGAir0037]